MQPETIHLLKMLRVWRHSHDYDTDRRAVGTFL